MNEDFKSIRGQFFTVNEKVQEYLVELLTPQSDWRVLEPSAGSGDIMRAVLNTYPESNMTGWEIDETVISPDLNIEIGDFFTKAKNIESKFHSIIGNPPYVAWKNVEENTRQSAYSVKQRYSDKTNLYYLFMDRCIDLLEDNGELIFIQPKEWMYSTSALPVREKMLRTGTITHIIDGGEEKVFPDADVPAIMIFRFQKTPSDHHNVSFRKGFLKDITEWENRALTITEKGYWILTNKAQSESIKDWKELGDYFSVRVGIVSGADKIFNVSQHSSLQEFIKEGTVKDYRTTKSVEQYIDVHDCRTFEEIPEKTREYLLSHKNELIGRKITAFHENNWWKYGAIRNKKLMETSPQRIYTFAKTRSEKPFFIDNSATYFGGGLLALFPHSSEIDMPKALEVLNSSAFRQVCESFGLTTANKVSFQPKTLESVPFPNFGEPDPVSEESTLF